MIIIGETFIIDCPNIRTIGLEEGCSRIEIEYGGYSNKVYAMQFSSLEGARVAFKQLKEAFINQVSYVEV